MTEHTLLPELAPLYAELKSRACKGLRIGNEAIWGDNFTVRYASKRSDYSRYAEKFIQVELDPVRFGERRRTINYKEDKPVKEIADKILNFQQEQTDKVAEAKVMEERQARSKAQTETLMVQELGNELFDRITGTSYIDRKPLFIKVSRYQAGYLPQENPERCYTIDSCHRVTAEAVKKIVEILDKGDV